MELGVEAGGLHWCPVKAEMERNLVQEIFLPLKKAKLFVSMDDCVTAGGRGHPATRLQNGVGVSNEVRGRRSGDRLYRPYPNTDGGCPATCIVGEFWRFLI